MRSSSTRCTPTPTGKVGAMSDTRLDQARDEAGRRYPPWDGPDLTYPAHQVGKHITSAFVSGAMWADANPQPHTITLSQSEAILEAGRAGRYEDHETALRAAGIEVVDDE